MIGFKSTWVELTSLLVAQSDRADDNFREELITNKFDYDPANTILVCCIGLSYSNWWF